VLPIQTFGKIETNIFYHPGTFDAFGRDAIAPADRNRRKCASRRMRKIVWRIRMAATFRCWGSFTRELAGGFGMLGSGDAVGAGSAIRTASMRRSKRVTEFMPAIIETSLMLQFRPDLVDMAAAKNFVSSGIAMERNSSISAPPACTGFGWIAQDLNAEGAVGDASKGTADKGRKSAEHQVDGFIALLRDMSAFHLSRLFESQVFESQVFESQR